jgi:hypothetical protein
MSISPDTRLSVAPDVVFRDVAGETMILNLTTAIYFGLDDVGTRAWQLLVEKGTLAGVTSAMADEFDAPADVITADVSALFETLLQKGLIIPA